MARPAFPALRTGRTGLEFRMMPTDVWEPSTPAQAAAVFALLALDPAQRLWVLSYFCPGCGAADSACPCQAEC